MDQSLLAYHRRVAAVAVGVQRPCVNPASKRLGTSPARVGSYSNNTMGGSGPALICAQSWDFDSGVLPGSLSTCTVVSSISR